MPLTIFKLKKFLLSFLCLLFLLVSPLGRAQSIVISDITANPIFIPHQDALAMDISFAPISQLRLEIMKQLGLELQFRRSWNSQGEAHVTTITPIELKNLKPFIFMKEIQEIAEELSIQESDLDILGIGSGSIIEDQAKKETFFVLVHSENLLRIREEIQRRFLQRGGRQEQFESTHFYPHITIGHTHRDLHEQDGVIKDPEHSLDRRL